MLTVTIIITTTSPFVIITATMTTVSIAFDKHAVMGEPMLSCLLSCCSGLGEFLGTLRSQDYRRAFCQATFLFKIIIRDLW